MPEKLDTASIAPTVSKADIGIVSCGTESVLHEDPEKYF